MSNPLQQDFQQQEHLITAHYLKVAQEEVLPLVSSPEGMGLRALLSHREGCNLGILLQAQLAVRAQRAFYYGLLTGAFAALILEYLL